jgi:hypothetical protein
MKEGIKKIDFLGGLIKEVFQWGSLMEKDKLIPKGFPYPICRIAEAG